MWFYFQLVPKILPSTIFIMIRLISALAADTAQPPSFISHYSKALLSAFWSESLKKDPLESFVYFSASTVPTYLEYISEFAKVVKRGTKTFE